MPGTVTQIRSNVADDSHIVHQVRYLVTVLLQLALDYGNAAFHDFADFKFATKVQFPDALGGFRLSDYNNHLHLLLFLFCL